MACQCSHVITDRRSGQTRQCKTTRLYGSATKEGQTAQLCKRHYELAFYRDWSKTVNPPVQPVIAQSRQEPKRPQAPLKKSNEIPLLTKEEEAEDSDDEVQIAKLFDNELARNESVDDKTAPLLQFDNLGEDSKSLPEEEAVVDKEETPSRAMREKELMIINKGLDMAIMIMENKLPSLKGLRNDVQQDQDIQECLNDLAEEYGETIGLRDMAPEIRLVICLGLVTAGRYGKNCRLTRENDSEDPPFDE